MLQDKRRYTRIAPQKKAFASMGSTFSGICKLKDVSMNGIGISCISDIAPKSLDSQVNLFLPDEDVEVCALPCRIVYQKAETLPSSKMKGETFFKRFQCGIEFEELDKSQRKMLSDFIHVIELV